MQFKTPLAVVTGIFAFLCLYYLSFTFVSRGVENDAIDFATDSKSGTIDQAKKTAYLDSMWTEPVLNLGISEFTYKQVKEQEVKLGLDLRGGMNVTMEVSAADVLVVLSDNNPNPAFKKALAEAKAASYADSRSFVDIFNEIYNKQPNKLPLARIFANKGNDKIINFKSSDKDVLKYLNDEVNSTIDRSFEILRARIDKFGVTAPNIQRLQGTNRIQIELPGVDDPARVRKLLQGAAKLEFFEVYEANEWIPFFNLMNDKLVAEENSGGDASKSLLEADSSVTASTDTAANADSALIAAAGGSDSLKKKDTANKAEAKKDTAASKNSKTIARLFKPAQGGEGVIYVATKDTNKVNKLLNREGIRDIFPKEIAFLYGNKPMDYGQGGSVVPLYFIKMGRDGKAPLDGSVITNAYNDFEPLKGTPVVSMQMDALGTKLWRKLTAANLKRKVAIVLDNQVYSAPVVQSEIPNGSSQISGNFTIEEAKDLANILKAGRMPVPTRIVEEVVVGPTLGAESISQGLTSILVGLAVIVLFMVTYYAKSGIVANLAVLINILLILGMLVPMDAVLTLPGIAGIVLTIGMAVDANVLINERIKDELAMGTPMELAVTNGYNLASTSIWDANVTTMIAGVVLMLFGSGPVQGFATTLVIGIFTSLLTSVYITRIITEWQMSRGVKMTFSTNLSKGLFKNINYDFVGKRKIAYVASSIIIGAGIVSLVITGLNYGVDFKGGWSFIVSTNGNVNTEKLRSELTPYLEGAPEVKTYGSTDKVKITTTYKIEDGSEDVAAVVQGKLEEGLAASKQGKFEVIQGSKVGPTIARDIKSKSILAMIIAMTGIFAYIWLRFRKWEYALGSTIAVIHDTMIIITAYTLFKDILPFSLEIDQNFIAAILTIIGFSVNDNVVIFDRIREQIKEDGGQTDKVTLINKALNYTFSRTVITASTVFVVVLILLLFGGETIRGLSFALLIGVITGTYSTIYIAVPFLIDAGTSTEKEKAVTIKPAKA